MATLGSIAVKLGLDPSQFRTGLMKARAELAAFKTSIDGIAAKTDDFGKTLLTSAANASKFAIQVGGAASAAITLAPHLVGAWHAVEGFGKAAGSAAPALVALGVAGEFVKLTMTRTSQAVLRSFNPILDMLNATSDAASNVASKGLTKLSQGFAKANLPAIRAGMLDIADAENTVVAGVLKWGQSTEGVSAIRALTVSTGLAMQDLAPHVTRVATSFGNMVGRISAVSLAAGESGLSGVLDRLSGWMDRVNAATVSTGLDKLKADYEAVKNTITTVVDKGRELYAMWQANREAIGRVQDGLSLLALATGPIGLIVGIVGLLARHWDEIKATVEPFIGPFVAALSGLLAQLSPLVPVVAQLAASFLRELTPALQLMTPLLGIVVGLIQFLSPVLVPLAPVILGIVAALRVWTVVQGILNATLLANPVVLVIAAIVGLVAIIIYAWQHCQTFRDIVQSVWEAIKQIFIGAASVIVGIVKGFIDLITGNWHGLGEDLKLILLGALNIIVGLFVNLPGRILGALGNLAALFGNVGMDIIRGIGNGLSAGWSYLQNLVSNLAHSLLSAAKSALGIASPSKLFAGVGGNVGAGLAQGLLDSRGMVGAAMDRLNAEVTPGAGGALAIPTPRGVASATGSAAAGGPLLHIRGDGTPLSQLLVEVLRRSIQEQGGNVQGVLGA